jgi:NADH-quinone oxidoreductase subunit J
MNMTYLEPLVFYSFAGLMLLAAIAVIGLRNPVQSALSLVLCFFATAILWLTLHAEFLALILVLVYVGAVMTLFLFVIMMLDLDKVILQRAFAKYLPLGILLTAILAAVIIYSLLATGHTSIPTTSTASAVSNTKQLGLVLYTQYGYAFELAAVLLLISIIAAITLAFRGKKPRGKMQDPNEQIKVHRQDRVRLVKMAAEKKN